MNNLEYIETYFSKAISQQAREEFEQKTLADPEFAEDVAFYLSARQAAGMEQQDRKDQFKQIYEQYKRNPRQEVQRPALVRKLWPWAAAAAVLAALIFGWWAWFKPVSPEQLATNFVKENFETLPVSMGAREDSLQTGLRLFNDGKLTEALAQFENLARSDTSFSDAKKYAGIVSLRLGQYDKAIDYFTQLENTRLYANPGKFYHALALLKRNQPGDKAMARVLLQQVVQEDLEWKQVAEKWLKKF